MIQLEITFENTITVKDYNFLRQAVDWEEIEQLQAQKGINNSSFLITAVYETQTIGVARVVSDGGYIYLIVDVIVHPSYQGLGIGKELISKIMTYIDSEIKDGQRALINIMSAKGKEPFYKKCGFIENPTNHSGAGMTQWIIK